jgi:hypothetical protein
MSSAATGKIPLKLIALAMAVIGVSLTQISMPFYGRSGMMVK